MKKQLNIRRDFKPGYWRTNQKRSSKSAKLKLSHPPVKSHTAVQKPWFKNSPTATHGSQAVTGWQDDWFRSSHDYSQDAELESLEASTVVRGSRIQEMACSIDGTTDGINHVMMCAQGSDLPCSSVFRTVIRDRHGSLVASCVVAAQVMVNL